MKKFTILLGLFSVLLSGPVHAGFFTDLFKVIDRNEKIYLLNELKYDFPELYTQYRLALQQDEQLNNLAWQLDHKIESGSFTNSTRHKSVSLVELVDALFGFEVPSYTYDRQIPYYLDYSSSPERMGVFAKHLWQDTNWSSRIFGEKFKNLLVTDLELAKIDSNFAFLAVNAYQDNSRILYNIIPSRFRVWSSTLNENSNQLKTILDRLPHTLTADHFLDQFKAEIKKIKTNLSDITEITESSFCDRVPEALDWAKLDVSILAVKVTQRVEQFDYLLKSPTHIIPIKTGEHRAYRGLINDLRAYIVAQDGQIDKMTHNRLQVSKAILQPYLDELTSLGCNTKLRGHTHPHAGSNGRIMQQDWHPNFGLKY